MSSITEENQENLLKWVIRYVLIPLSLAVITGLFAIRVINLEIASRPTQPQQPSMEEFASLIFATITAEATRLQPAATATPQPSSTPTAEPTPTQEASLPTTPAAAAPGNGVASTNVTAVCGQVPVGWQLYTVQPGNTLYSLARWSGTTIANIQQANCLNGQLMAYSRIWLPPFFVEPVEPIVEVTPATVTPTITVTEETALPDLINDTRDWPTLFETCDVECVTRVNLAVMNVGTAVSDSFDVFVRIDPEQSVTIVGVLDGLAPGQTGTLTLSSPLGESCYDPNCTVCITVDSRGAITEANESNNQYCTAFSG
ncbi:CARDB domain-containing protein [Candidatus Leptofilum sp.]|uniref:CARDB domain-containing protein n=1 Tax=Candidatus Leptofilum sp. TaxID=3241576 RepID=UPI003B5B7EA1